MANTASRPRPARRSAPTARPSPGWARTSASRRRCCPKKPGLRTTPSRCGGASQPGSETSTERVTGGSDPGNPACVASGEGGLPASPSPSDPCQGPFVVEEQGNPRGILNEDGGQTGDFVPRLSADGYTVAFVSQAPLVASGENFGRSEDRPGKRPLCREHAPWAHARSGAHPADRARGRRRRGPRGHRADLRLRHLPRRQPGRVRDRAHPLPARLARVCQHAGRRSGDERTVRRRPRRRHAHARHPRLSGSDEASEHAHSPVVAGEDPYKEQPGDGALSPSFSDDGDDAGVLLDRLEPRVRRRQRASARACRRPAPSTAATRSSSRGSSSLRRPLPKKCRARRNPRSRPRGISA